VIERVLTEPRRAWIKSLAKRRLRRYGYTLVPMSARGAGAPAWDVWNWIKGSADVRTVIDIGANDGKYVAYLNEHLRPRRIHAFEPLPACRPALRALEARLPHLTVHDVALDERDGEATFYENAYGPASSLLPVSAQSKRAFPETARESARRVPLARLDDVLPVERLERDVLIKIDVQGVEDRVIRGGRAVFSAATFVLIEMSFVPMYEGQPLFEEVHELLVGCGLRLAGFKNQIDDVESGRPLFAHCFYRRADDLRGGRTSGAPR
jgi:FkbM family methyltransferase